MRKYLFEFDTVHYIKKFPGTKDEAFESAMNYARKLHDALGIPIRFYPLVSENAITVEK